jgi:hypothetical protein
VLTGSWGHGIRLNEIQTGDNVLQIDGGYIYCSLTTNAAIADSAASTSGHWARQIMISGTLFTTTGSGQYLFDIALIGALWLNGIMESATASSLWGPNAQSKASSGRTKAFLSGFSVNGATFTLNTGANIDNVYLHYETNGNIINDWQDATYIPAWSSTGTAPSLGNGTLTATYHQRGTRVSVSIHLIWGSTTSAGTGSWRFTLPALDVSSKYIGTGVAAHSGGSTYPVTCYTFANGTQLIEVTTGSPTTVFSATSPFTWGSGDALDLNIEYDTTF